MMKVPVYEMSGRATMLEVMPETTIGEFRKLGSVDL